jgi:phosphoribosyl 1,2-cyclic phosphate phosphodiesterase
MGQIVELTFLGTGDSTGYPHPFCTCTNCTEARSLGGPSLRLRSSALIDSELLIDLSPDLLAATFRQGTSLADVRYCLQTHPHIDHLDAAHLFMRSARFGVSDLPEFALYGTDASLARIRQTFAENKATANWNLLELLGALETTLIEVKPHHAFRVGRYDVVAVPASHDLPGTSLLYAISDGTGSIFYGNDTGAIDDQVWETLKAHHLSFDVVVLDHTYGIKTDSPSHMNSAVLVQTIARMNAEGLLKPGARCLANHIGHHSNPAHPKLVEFAAMHGYEVAYDGLTISVGVPADTGVSAMTHSSIKR